MSLGRGATVWRPWADGVHAVGELARLLGNLSANGRHAVAPLPMPRHNKGQYPLLGLPQCTNAPKWSYQRGELGCHAGQGETEIGNPRVSPCILLGLIGSSSSLRS